MHIQEITGLGLDSLNKTLVSASLDGTLKLWDFFRRELIRTFSCEYPVECMTYNRNNDLVAVA